MQTSLVTGGAGFIGSHLVGALLKRGDRVRVLDNFTTGQRANLAGLSGSLEVLEGDLRDASLVSAAVRDVDLVFHQAAMVSVLQSIQDPQSCFDVNVRGTHQLLEAARQAGVQRVVLASSAAVYGDSDRLPVTENTPLRPRSPYATSKRVNELYAQLYSDVFDLPVVALRYFNVYGPRQSPDSDYAAVIPIFIKRLLDGQEPTIFGDGHQKRDFIHVDDVVHANLLAAGSSDAAGAAYNVCTGREVSLLELLSALAEVLHTSPHPQFAPPRSGDIYRSFGDPGLADQTFGFQARIRLVDGLAGMFDRSPHP